jgi:hypothetical protein
MKNYLLFHGAIYYPGRGMDDFVGDYDTIVEAMQALEDVHNEENPDDLEWDMSWGYVWSVRDRKKVHVR